MGEGRAPLGKEGEPKTLREAEALIKGEKAKPRSSTRRQPITEKLVRETVLKVGLKDSLVSKVFQLLEELGIDVNDDDEEEEDQQEEEEDNQG